VRRFKDCCFSPGMNARLCLSGILCGLLVGCASVGHPIDQDKLSQVTRGKSTYADVVSLMGEPQNVHEVDGPSGKRTEMLYLYSFTSADGKNFIPYYGSFAQEYHSKTQTVTITLDGRGVVDSIAKNFGGLNVKSGTASETPIEPKKGAKAAPARAPVTPSAIQTQIVHTNARQTAAVRPGRPFRKIVAVIGDGKHGLKWFYFQGIGTPVFLWTCPVRVV
jgi:outer membrane protein assembly factor BamE (lipoprotein component of BamABCDE complex)